MQELALRLTNFSMFGPRLACLIGGLFAATTSVGWFLSRKNSKVFSFVLGIIFLLDPIFVFSYRSGRVDCWVLGLCLASCWILSDLVLNLNLVSWRNKLTKIGLAGMLSSIAFFVWPSVVMVYPLVLVQLYLLNRQIYVSNANLNKCLIVTIVFIGTSIATAILLMIPIWQDVISAFSNIFVASGGTGNTLGRLSKLLEIKSFVYSFRISPFLFLTTLLVLIVQKPTVWVYPTLFATSIAMITNSYPFRVLYLLPYSLILISQFNIKWKSYINIININRFVQIAFLCILLVWSIGISLIYRPVLSLTQNASRDHSILLNTGIQEIGLGADKKVYDSTLQFYYVGRSLGWEMFRPIKHDGTQWNQKLFETFLSKVDYAIVPEDYGSRGIDTFSNNEPEVITKAGFEFYKIIVDINPNNKFPRGFMDVTSLGGGLPYGSYKLYKRTP
ncbi:MAG: hypothetical protein VKL60_03035 [Sphaerospermopsis sp.]|nr:hypothetical protein [Sphaerospermopsis sp.]